MSTSYDPTQSHQRVGLKGVHTRLKIGVTDAEKALPNGQAVVVDVEMYTNKAAHTGETLDSCLNYHPLYLFITERWPNEPHTDLLETRVEELVQQCFADARVQACRASITKLEIYGDTGRAFVEFYRVR